MRIGIVNDMPMAVEVLRRALAQQPAYSVLWVASNGAEALANCHQQLPDVVLMDIFMPVMDGVEATRRIMLECPCPILLVTGDSERNMSKVFEAMGCGALDVVNTPVMAAGQVVEASAFLRKIHNVGWMSGQYIAQPPVKATSANHSQQRLLAIGSSAGGPTALASLLKQLPTDFPAAVVLVQHVDESFALGMASWLSSESPLPVRLAREGEAPVSGTVLLAGTNNHMQLRGNGQLTYTKDDHGLAYCPSVDLFFDSLVAHWRGEAIGVLLTGMGNDGAAGLLHMRERGWLTLSQDQASCAVYGMPRAAAALNAAVEVLPLPSIAPRVLKAFA
jgi:two-component system, chemotaxis family, response regulator WspF